MKCTNKTLLENHPFLKDINIKDENKLKKHVADSNILYNEK